MRSSVHVTIFLAALVTLLIVHTLATEFYLYWRFGFLDLSVHVLAGAVIALGVFLLPIVNVRLPRYLYSLPSTLAIVLLFGFGWEVYEYISEVTIYGEGFWMDTFIDMVMDLVGGYIGHFVAVRVRSL